VDDLIRAVWPRAYRIAFSVVRNHMLAEDAAQEACAILFRSIRHLRSAEAFGVWFYRIVVRQAVAVEKRNVTVSARTPALQTCDLDRTLERIDMCTVLARLIPQQRIAIALHYYAEMNSREIAEILGIQDSSVRFHIMRAKQSLEKSLKEQIDDHAPLKEPYGAA
jgi:RNA polymerase sigma-70 factor (ECF subfamily)